MKYKLILIIALFLLALPIVNSAKYSVTNNSWTIYDSDRDCFSSECIIPFSIENAKNQVRVLPVEVLTNPKPTDIQILKNVTVGYSQGSLIGCLNVSKPTNSTPRTKLINCTYNQIPIKQMQWTDLNSSITTITTGNKKHKINTTGLNFFEHEIKYFKVILKTILGGFSKFDILWHDPIINSTLYRANFSIDNATGTTAQTFNNGRTISLGVG